MAEVRSSSSKRGWVERLASAKSMDSSITAKERQEGDGAH